MTLQNVLQFARFEVPDADRVVRASRDDLFTAFDKRSRLERTPPFPEGAFESAGPHVPDLHEVIAPATDQPLVVCREKEELSRRLVSEERSQRSWRFSGSGRGGWRDGRCCCRRLSATGRTTLFADAVQVLHRAQDQPVTRERRRSPEQAFVEAIGGQQVEFRAALENRR